MRLISYFGCGCFLLLALVIDITQPTCVLESDFGFKINCAFKKSGLFRVRNLGGVKAHASIGFSLGDDLGFDQSYTNLDQSRRRSVNVKDGPPNIVADSSKSNVKQEKRGRIMMRPPATPNRSNKAAMDKLSSLHRRVSTTMKPIIVDNFSSVNRNSPAITMAKPVPMGVPVFRPLPPKEDTLSVLPIAVSTKKSYTPLQYPQSKGPGMAYQSENYNYLSHDKISKLVSQMTASHISQPQYRITAAPIIVTPKLFTIPTTVHPFVPMPIAAPPTHAMTIIPAPSLNSIQIPSKLPIQNTIDIQTIPFVDPVSQKVHDLASAYAANTKKVDDYNSITGYGDDTVLKFNKEDINEKIVEIAKAGNISMEAVEAAIALRQQQLLNKYTNFVVPTEPPTTTTTTEPAIIFQPEPEIIVAPVTQKPKRMPNSGKVMNAPREYYPVGYEKNFDDHFQSKVDLPETNFYCGDQKYFPGLYGDENLGCMVFHVCALTDDGLVMKSFLCPESTLFDQTILKCNWWFYVDCKHTRRLYETNVPVSKSYQLMKALTFFSSYNKDNQDGTAPSLNPEDDAGIKQAISIIENQDSSMQSQFNSEPNGLQVVTPTNLIDERNNHKMEVTNEKSPVYRETRNYKNSTSGVSTNRGQKTSEEMKPVIVNANSNIKTDSKQINQSIANMNSSERKYKRTLTLKDNTPNIVQATSTVKPIDTTPGFEIIKQEIQQIESFNLPEIKQETLQDQIDSVNPSVLLQANSPVKRYYRSSAEKDFSKEENEYNKSQKANVKNDNSVEKEMAIVNNEKVQIVRPTPISKLVGDYSTPTDTVLRLDEAILGSNIRHKKAVTIVTPERPRSLPNNDQR